VRRVIFAIETTAFIVAHGFGSEALTVKLEALGFFAGAAHIVQILFVILDGWCEGVFCDGRVEVCARWSVVFGPVPGRLYVSV